MSSPLGHIKVPGASGQTSSHVRTDLAHASSPPSTPQSSTVKRRIFERANPLPKAENGIAMSSADLNAPSTAPTPDTNVPSTTSKRTRPKYQHALDMYVSWDLTIWKRLIARGGPTIREVFGLLDMAVPEKDTKTKGAISFDDPVLIALDRDVCKVAAKIPKDDELPAVAADNVSMEEEKEGLLEKHGALVWGRDKGRKLVFESENDRAEILLHLHQWIFLKAFNTWRNGVDEAKRRKKRKDQAAANRAAGLTPTVGKKRPAPPSSAGGIKKAVKLTATDGLRAGVKREEEAEAAAGLKSTASPPTIRKIKKMKTPSSRREGAVDPQAAPAPLRKEPRDPFTTESEKEHLFELAAHLVKYLYNKPDTITAAKFLTLLLNHWTEYAAHYEKLFRALYPAASHVLTSWIAERRGLSDFEDSLSLSEDINPEDRFLAANDIRIKRVKWNNLSVQHHGEMMDSADVLCYVFAKICEATGRGTLEMMRGGLELLHGSLGCVEGGEVVILME